MQLGCNLLPAARSRRSRMRTSPKAPERNQIPAEPHTRQQSMRRSAWRSSPVSRRSMRRVSVVLGDAGPVRRRQARTRCCSMVRSTRRTRSLCRTGRPSGTIETGHTRACAERVIASDRADSLTPRVGARVANPRRSAAEPPNTARLPTVRVPFARAVAPGDTPARRGVDAMIFG